MSRHAGRRQYLHRTGHPTYRIIRYADDLVLLVKGTRTQAEALLQQLAGRVQALGLSLKSEKTAVTHIDEGFVFLGQRIVRRPKGRKRYVYTFVSNEALASVRRKVKALTGRSTTNLELSELIAALNPVLRGWTNYFLARRGQTHLRLPRLLRLVARRALASQEAPADDLEADRKALHQRRRLPGQRDRAVEPRQHQRYPLPLPRSADPRPVEHRTDRRPERPTRATRQPRGATVTGARPTGARMNRNHSMCPWRAGCGGSRKSGSVDGGEETTGRKTGTGASPPIQREVEVAPRFRNSLRQQQ